MKRMKKLTALLLSGVMMLGLASCGPKEKTPGEVLGEAVTKLSKVKNVEAKSTMEMEMSLMGETMNMDMDMDIVSFNDPVKARCDVDMKVAGQGTGKITYYIQQDGDKYTMYFNDGQQWNSQVMELGDMSQFDAQQNIDLYTKHMENLTVTEEDGKNRFDGVIKGSAIEEVVKASGALDNVGAGMDAEMLKGMFEGVGDLPISVWVDPESGYPVRYYMDMSGIMSGMMEKMMSSMGSEASGLDLKISKMAIAVEYSNFDAAADFEIPAEALDAAA